jgi:parallel beta-helix repeat protein
MRIFCALLLTIVCLSVAAADSFEAVATFNNVGVEYTFDVAPPAGTSVEMAIKPAGDPGPYQTIHPLSPVASDTFKGSAFELADGTEYSVRLSSTAFVADQFLSVTTRTDAFPSATGSVYHVDPAGSDANGGSSQLDAFASLGHALTVAGAGDEIRMHNGTYYEGDLSAPASGTATNPIVIRSAPGEHAVLSGVDPSFSPAFVVHDGPANVYKTPLATQPMNAYVNGEHMFRYETLADLVSEKWDVPGGYYADGSDLYVRFPNGDAPGAHTVTVPKHTTGITLEHKSNIQIRDLEVAYYGLDAFHRGIYINGGDYNLVDGCDLHHNGIGVALKSDANFNTIQNSTFDESPAGDWPFDAVKNDADDYETGAIFVFGSTTPNVGNVIRNNWIENQFDGAHLYSFFADGPTQNMDFHNNSIVNVTDDAIETDGAGSNVRIYENTLSDFLTGISIAPGHGGPTYIIRNLLTDWASREASPEDLPGYPFKFNVSSPLSTDWVYLYHNTASTDETLQDGFLFKGYSDWHNLISRNNIYAGTSRAMRTFSGVTYDGEIDFDYDALYTTHPSRYILWDGVNYLTLADFRAATGHEPNGFDVPPDFVDPAGGNYHLEDDSGLVDVGLIIPGVNDDYFGLGPEVGAFENTADDGLEPIAEPGALGLTGLALLAVRRPRA